ncbi:GH-E family nuclease [Clostridium felsineum]|uniref:GH-E family nuclease n=1 Tax=Clostridium felsineum TaxID=36839 RepID=UPI0009D27B08|nr:GH-E family nuclease [Clostridium felsineum]URZ15090.1 hypothetical protein CLFE_011070 [Clostridium felsineum DSM 794]
MEESGKYVNTCFSASGAAGAGAEAIYKATKNGFKEAKNALRTVKDGENGLKKASGVIKGETDSLYKRGGFRKGSRTKAEGEAPKNTTGKMICPTCGKEIPESITINTKRGPIKRIGYDLDHYPDTWAERVNKMKAGEVKPTRKEVLDEYNKRLRVQCHECNICHKFEGIEGNYKGVKSDD